MSNSEHRLGVPEANLVVRHLKLEEAEAVGSARIEFDRMYGLDAVAFDEKTQLLNLAYDASRVRLDGVEAILAKHGIAVAPDWWIQFKQGYDRFVGENLADKAKHQPWSCHQAPPDIHKNR